MGSDDPATPLLGIYLEKTVIQKDICIPVFTAALFTIDRTWKQPMSINRGMNKGDAVHTYNGVLLCHKKQQNCATSEMRMNLEAVIDSEVRKKKNNDRIINAYMWHLEKWYR